MASHHSLAKSSQQRAFMSTTVVILFPLFAFSLSVFLAVSRSRRRQLSRENGQFSSAKCANPQHRTMKSSDQAELRSVRPAVLRAVRGDTSRKTKICMDCIVKLSGKPKFRHLFHGKVCMLPPPPTPPPPKKKIPMKKEKTDERKRKLNLAVPFHHKQAKEKRANPPLTNKRKNRQVHLLKHHRHQHTIHTQQKNHFKSRYTTSAWQCWKNIKHNQQYTTTHLWKNCAKPTEHQHSARHS